MFAAEVKAELEALRGQYPKPKAALVPVLHVVQREKGWIDAEVQKWVAGFLDCQPIDVHEVVSFYPMLYGRPVGQHVLHLCRTLSCDTCGGRDLWQHLQQKLGIGRGETTADGKFTLLSAECLASCGTAPVMLVDGERHENLTAEQVDRILESAS